MGTRSLNEEADPYTATPAWNPRPIVHLDTYHTRALVSIIDDLGAILSCEPVPSGADPNSSLVRSHRRTPSTGGAKFRRGGPSSARLHRRKRAATRPPPSP